MTLGDLPLAGLERLFGGGALRLGRGHRVSGLLLGRGGGHDPNEQDAGEQPQRKTRNDRDQWAADDADP